MFAATVTSRLASFTFIFLLVLNTNAQKADISTLKFLHVIWRHGDRTPSKETFPSDVGNRAETWPEGLGELTTIGMRQHFETGKYLRQRYDGFIPRKYHASEIYVRSSSYNRAIMSAQANMAGLFQPEGDQIWNSAILWQPVPIQTIPRADDPMLWTNRPCPTATRLFEDYRENSPETKETEQKYSRLLKFLEEKTGWNRPLDIFQDIYDTYDALHCQLQHNDSHTWPDWVNMTIYEELKELNDVTGRMLYPTIELQRFRGGPVLGDLLTRMKNQTLQDAKNRLKLYVYSAHDSTMTALFSNLGAMQPHSPPYTAMLMIELHQIDNEHYVELYYRNDTTRDAYPIEVGECPRPCTLQQFAARSESRIPQDWYKECGIDQCKDNSIKGDKIQEKSTLSTALDALGALLSKIFNPKSSSRI